MIRNNQSHSLGSKIFLNLSAIKFGKEKQETVLSLTGKSIFKVPNYVLILKRVILLFRFLFSVKPIWT